MSEKKKPEQDPTDADRAGVEDILGGLLGSNASGMPQGGASEATTGGSGDLAGMLGGLMGGGSGSTGASSGGGDLMGLLGGLMGGGSGSTGASGGGGDLMGLLGGLMGGGSGSSGASGGGDLMGLLGGLLGGGSQQNSSVSAGSPSILSALLPLVLGMLGGGGGRAGEIDLDERTAGELRGMFGAAQSGELDMGQVRSAGIVQDVAAQTGASEDEVADTLAQLMRMLGGQS